MSNHAPQNYKCPICLGIAGKETADTLLKQADLVYRDELVSVFINSFWVEGNEGHVIVVPNEHFENIYAMPSEYGYRVFEITKKFALIIKKAYQADGITIRQNNEPAGDQHAFHYHLHIYPRYQDDKFNQNVLKPKNLSNPKKRVGYAQKLKDHLR